MLAYFLLFLLVLGSQQDGPLTCLELGACYQGSWYNTDNGNRFASFQGVQYATHPVGELRFKSPQPCIAGEAIFDVSGVSEVMCPQLDFLSGSLVGQEDCLLLNIYVPESAFTDAQAPLPVMFWIHGGSLLFWSNKFDDYGPQHLIDRGVIVVTVNYRLGPLGFLSLGTDLVPGNAGLKDQAAGLSWVKENIASFGGDPDSVTIFGESAGSLSVALHMLSPMSTGLFQRAILQSCTAVDPAWGPITPEHAKQYASLLADGLGCEKEEDTLACMQEASMSDIVSLTSIMEGDKYGVWMPVPDSQSSQPFLPGYPEDLLKTGQLNTDVEVVIGTNKDDGMFYVIDQLMDPSKWNDFKENFDVNGPRVLFNIADASEVTDEDIENAHKLAEYYVGSVDNLDEEHQQGVFDMFTDAGFLYGTFKTINYLLEQDMTVYQYVLTYQGEYSFSQVWGVDPAGVCHADDLIYIWEPVAFAGTLEGEDVLVRNTITSAWANFATYGDPTPPGSESTWTPSDHQHKYWNIADHEPSMASNNDIMERMELWRQVVG